VKVDIVMPTGAMGNIVGGYMGKLIGVPLGYLCSGVNINDITHRVIQSGQFHKSDAMLGTLSDAINIQVVRIYFRIHLSGLYHFCLDDD
jgi:threonine synthase